MPEITRPPVSLQEYIDSLNDVQEQESIEHLFHGYDSLVDYINNQVSLTSSSKTQITEIRVTYSDKILVEAGLGVIYVSVSFIHKCLNFNFVPFSEVQKVSNPFGDSINTKRFIASGMMLWALAHELFHTVRKHGDAFTILQKQEGFDPVITNYALEMDADLCAIAVLFRFVQHTFHNKLDDLGTRQLSIYIVYWILRKDFAIPNTASHTSNGLRFFDLIAKLSIVTVNPGEIVDSGFQLPISHIRHAAILECFENCENSYQGLLVQSGLKRDNKMVWDNLLNDMNDLYQAIGKRWDEIEPLVTKLSSN